MDGKRKGFLVALAIGLVAAPALALVASGLLGGQAKAGEPPVTDAPVAAATTTSAADLVSACTSEGADLVARESAGTLSDLQQAALDALRPICEAEGFSLEAAPTAEIEAPVTAAAAFPTAGAAQFDDNGDEGEYGGGGQAQYEDHEDESDEHGRDD